MTEPTADHVHDDTDVPASHTADEKWPIGFILTIVMVGGYLAYRLIQGIVLFFEWVF